MTTYAKLIDGKLIPAPQRVEIDGSVIFNPMPDTLLKLGYKGVIYPVAEEIDPEAPQVEPTPTREVYTEDEAHIYVSYEVVVVTPENPSELRRQEYIAKANESLLAALSYEAENKTDQAVAKIAEHLNIKTQIREMYPDNQ